MLKESYLANMKNLPEEAVKIRVSRPSVLGPSKGLLLDYKQGKVIWQEFERRFRKEILNKPSAMTRLGYISALADKKDVYLICYEKEYPCHRFILIDIIQELNDITKKSKSQII